MSPGVMLFSSQCIKCMSVALSPHIPSHPSYELCQLLFMLPLYTLCTVNMDLQVPFCAFSLLAHMGHKTMEKLKLQAPVLLLAVEADSVLLLSLFTPLMLLSATSS